MKKILLICSLFFLSSCETLTIFSMATTIGTTALTGKPPLAHIIESDSSKKVDNFWPVIKKHK